PLLSQNALFWRMKFYGNAAAFHPPAVPRRHEKNKERFTFFKDETLYNTVLTRSSVCERRA
ncbi:hypothetical protein, partial [uncultured Desulfovibrio sp.]|uniref:hypothetical protein n=1 Tax=uncultured Desulfovibrio sp. TaxID=167968 RepID=UPI002629B1E1